MIRQLPLAVLILIMPFASLTKGGAKGEKEQAKADAYFPLQIGNSWVYECYDPDDPQKKEIITVRVAKTETIDGMSLTVLSTKADAPDAILLLPKAKYVKWTDKGFYRCRVDGLVLDPPILELKSPIKPGDKWEGTFHLAKDDVVSYTCETGEEAIEVPAGKFNTLRVKTTTKSGGTVFTTVTVWYARDVGEVKSVNKILRSETVQELKKFELKKPGPK